MGRSHIRAGPDARVGEYGVALRDLPRPLDPLALFGRSAPLELEVGSGKGTFLVGAAEACPERLFVGVERARRYFRYAADRLRRRGLRNARVICGDAMEVLLGLPESCLAGVHVYFPDPWPKRRHQRRRLVDPGFVEAVERALAPGGLLRVVTDFKSYFNRVRDAVATRIPLTEIPYPPPPGAGDREAAGSNFERKYRAQGRPIHRIAAVRAEARWQPSSDWPAIVATVARRVSAREDHAFPDKQ